MSSPEFSCTIEKSSITRSWYPLAQQLGAGTGEDSWASSFEECVGLSIDGRTDAKATLNKWCYRKFNFAGKIENSAKIISESQFQKF